MKRWVLWSTAGAVAVAAVLAGLFLLPDADGPPEAKEDAQTSISYGDHLAEQARLAELGYDVHTDSDGDGLADVLENFLYGSDPQAFSTTGNGIPDGWFAIYGYDPTVAGVEARPAATPPEDELANAYHGQWPDKYRWSLADVYRHGIDDANETFHDNGIDPNQWAAPSGLPMAWLVHHDATDDDDWNITDPDLAERSVSGDGFTVRQNYDHDTDPHLTDTDGDGLSDRQEVDRYGTDPTRFSSSGAGAPDGWLVLHELDPLDRQVGSLDPAGKGMTVADVWHANAGNFSLEDALEGKGLDPTEMSHRGDGVPDGWLVENRLDPLDPDVTKSQSQCAREFQDVRHLDEAPEGLEPIPDLCLSVEQAYLHGRPTTWEEKTDGPWPGGLDPASGDQDEDGLPDAVEIRGWYVQRFVDLGPVAKGEWIHVTSDPLRGDTDGDGLADDEEHHGEAERDGQGYRFPVTDPSNPDTAFSGMTDAEKVFATIDGTSWKLHNGTGGALQPLLDPTRRDTAGDYLADGDAMRYWIQASENVRPDVSYKELYPGSLHENHLSWMNRLDWLSADLDWDEAAALMGPDGNVDNDKFPNVVDREAGGDGLLNGWQVDPSTLRFSEHPAATSDRPRAPTDPANPDTDGDDLPDAWELRHGRWDDDLDGWDLDPSTWNSNGDGTTEDGEGNLDGDEVPWHAYENGQPLVNEPWSYTNILEYNARTDPRLKDQDNNGVTEGWVAFWTTVYPNLLAQVEAGQTPDQNPGDVVPPRGDAFDAVRDSIGNPNTDVGELTKDKLQYYRFAVMVKGDEDPTFLDDGEEYVGDIRPIQVADGEDEFIAVIKGTHEHTHAHDQDRGLNPYLSDTDDDGLRDAWEAYFADHDECITSPDPVAPDARSDPDGDGLDNMLEYELGTGTDGAKWNLGDGSTHPCMADTDLDGRTDRQEMLLPGRSPLNPEDASVGGGSDDTDGDGATDEHEVGRKLDPADPDTDRDGLLDHSNMPTSGTTMDDPDIESLQALGIAHKLQVCPGRNQEICFYGEDSNEGLATRFDKILSGVPDGWAVYYQQKTPDAKIKDRYTCGMPTWWQREVLGVWWWGVDPQDECPGGSLDLDLDGLDDRNGEDPVPAASRSNHAAGTDLQDLMADPPEDPLDLVRTAQAWGGCAGDPDPCFSAWENAGLPDQEPVHIADLEVTGAGVDLSSVELAKQKAFTVTGSLVLDDGSAVPNRTVVLRLWPDQPTPLEYSIHRQNPFLDGVTLGVAFTDQDGDFTIDGCLCAGGDTIEVPEGFTALGRSNTTAAWDPQAATIPVGSQWTLGVHAYASTATFWGDDRDDDTHPQYLEVAGASTATESRWKEWGDVEITSATSLTIDDGVPDQIAWGDDRILPVTVQLRDASGGALDDQAVTITVTGAPSPLEDLEESVTTDSEGKAAIEFDELGDRTGTWNVMASYGGDAEVGLEASDAEIVAITLQAPLTLTAPADEPVVRLGEPTEFTVTADSQGTLVQGLEVTASLGAMKKAAETDQDGVATFSITPTDMAPGAATVTFSASSTDEYASASVTQGITLISGSLLQPNLPDAGNLGAPISLSGCLTLTDGTALDGRTVDATLAEKTLGEPFSTDDEGCFRGAPVVPLDLGIGVHTLRLTYAGETDAIDSATVEKSVRFSVGTLLSLDDLHAGRGQGASLSGRLTSITGVALVGETLNVTLPWNETISVLARGGGNFSQEVAVPADHELGVFQVNASYAGSTNGTYGASKIQALLEVGSPSRIEAGPLGILHRGNNTVTGALRDDETDAPIVDATIHATPSTGEPRTLQTDDEGRFRFSLSLARDIPGGDINVAFHYAGDEGYAPAQNTSHGILRVPARLSIAMPLELGRGTSHDVDVRLTDDRGAPLSTRNVTLSALDTTWNATTDTDGNARFALDVPIDTDLGATRISAAYAGDEAHDQAQVTREAAVKDGVHVNIDGMPDEVLPGQRVTLSIYVEDTSGRPVQTPVLVRIDGVPGSLLVETDDLGRAEAPIVVPDTGAEALRVTVRFPGTDVLAARTESMQPTLGVATQAAAPTTGWPWMATAAVAAVLVAATAAFVLLRRRRLDATDILQDTEKRITAGDPWAAAVLDAYRRLVELVQAYGIEDDESQTGRAFAQTLVDAGFLDERAARELVALFERARYAGDAMDSADADEARRVLQGTIGAVQRTEAHRGGAPA